MARKELHMSWSTMMENVASSGRSSVQIMVGKHLTMPCNLLHYLLTSNFSLASFSFSLSFCCSGTCSNPPAPFLGSETLFTWFHHDWVSLNLPLTLNITFKKMYLNANPTFILYHGNLKIPILLGISFCDHFFLHLLIYCLFTKSLSEPGPLAFFHTANYTVFR